MDASLTTNAWIGRIVEVVVDRALGTLHPRHPDIRYELNYGFVPGTLAPDGEPLDAYLVGLDCPVERASGTVVAIIRRRDDIEDKLVVAVGDVAVWDAVAIEAAVHFQERYFDSYIEMAL